MERNLSSPTVTHNYFLLCSMLDTVCNLCNNAVNLALDWDPEGKLRFSALQSNVGRALLEANGRKADDISSIVLVTKDGAFIKSDAVLKITEELTPLSLLPLKPAAVFHMINIYKYAYILKYEERLLSIRSNFRFSAA